MAEQGQALGSVASALATMMIIGSKLKSLFSGYFSNDNLK